MNESLDLKPDRPSDRQEPAATATRLKFVRHPNFIWRIGGEPAHLLKTLSDGESYGLLERTERLREEARALTGDICAAIERLIPSLDDNAARHEMLALKRDLFTLRSVKRIPAALTRLDEGVQAEVAGAIARAAEIADLEASFDAVFAAELMTAEGRLGDHFRRANISNGLRVVNAHLHRKLERHFATRRTTPANKQERELNVSFLQYLSRVTLKPSPMSSFTLVMLGRWSPDGRTDHRADLAELEVVRRASLRRSLLLEILSALVRKLAPPTAATPLRLNRTARPQEGLLVLNRVVEAPSLKAMTWGVGLEEVRLKMSPALMAIIGAFDRAGVKGLRIEEFARVFGERVPPEQVAALLRTVGELAKVGVLQRTDGFHEQEDPVVAALALLAPALGEDHPVVRDLRVLSADLPRYEAEPGSAARSAIADDIGARLRGLAEKAPVELSTDIVSPFLYEDGLAGGSDVMAEQAVEAVSADLQRLLALSPLFDMNAGLQSWLAESFIEQFGAEGTCADPRAFLLAQMRKLDNVIAPWTIGEATSATRHGSVLHALRSEFYDHIVGRIERDGHASVDPAFIDDLASRLPPEIARRPKSHCFFGQFASGPDGTSRFVLNQILSGNSQLFSRFLETEEDARAVNRYLHDTSRQGTFVELSGVFGFNANLHRRIADDSLMVAPHAADRTDSRIHDFDRMTLKYDRALHRLHLSDEAERPVDLYYLGLLNPGLVPQIQRVLCGLSSQAPIFFSDLSSAMRRGLPGDLGPVFATPRVTLGAVVLQRSAVNVANSALPQLNKLDHAQAFVAIRQWRERHGVPLRGFVRFSPSREQLKVAGTEASEVDWSTFDRTKLKPFYVDFSNAMFVRQFVKSCTAMRFDMVIQEVLPDVSDQSLTVRGEGHVAELQIEISALPAD